jgi:hypothetical protein
VAAALLGACCCVQGDALRSWLKTMRGVLGQVLLGVDGCCAARGGYARGGDELVGSHAGEGKRMDRCAWLNLMSPSVVAVAQHLPARGM